MRGQRKEREKGRRYISVYCEENYLFNQTWTNISQHQLHTTNIQHTENQNQTPKAFETGISNRPGL